jgi:dTDP-4-amino-4,6-dideoxygalactose transaminase
MAPTKLADRVPFVDVASSLDPVREQALADIESVIDSGTFVNGPAVADFEDSFAEYCGAKHCVGLASGLDAVRLALQALEVGPGDEVIVPAMTFVATWEAVSQVGARPVPVDISPIDYGLDVAAAPEAASPRTRAIIPVYLYGLMMEPAPLLALAASTDAVIVEDACQAHGARRDGRMAGSIGRAGAFSFYPTKNLGAMGDAGALVTSDEELAARARALREHGQSAKYSHRWVGWTSRLDTIQAVALRRKLPLLDRWNEERRAAAAAYSEALAGVGDLVLPPGDGPAHVWHVYVVQTADPAGLAAHLREHGVDTGRHYPEPPHLSEAYADLGYGPGSFPVAEQLARSCLSLPLFPGLSEAQLDAVVAAVRSWFARG